MGETIRPYEQDDYRACPRFDVTKASDGYAVAGLGTFASIGEAFAAVLQRGGRVHLSWGRTVIAGETVPEDYAATFDGEEAGRIYHDETGFHEEVWRAFPGGHNRETSRIGGGSMMVETKDEAVAFIERKFTELMAGVRPESGAK